MLASSMSIICCLLISIFEFKLPVFAQLTPTGPGPNETFYAHSSCNISWVPDSTGDWTNVSIQLMSGSNSNMSTVTNVVSGLDGTNATLTPFSWSCPEVEPYSAIYFYQFTNSGNFSNATWTTRFTIASSSGVTTPPPEPVQSDGSQVPWGVGHLVNMRFTTRTTTSTHSITTKHASGKSMSSATSNQIEGLKGYPNSVLFSQLPTATNLPNPANVYRNGAVNRHMSIIFYIMLLFVYILIELVVE